MNPNPLKQLAFRATLRDPCGFALMGLDFARIIHGKTEHTLHGGLGFPWRCSQEMLSHVRNHEESLA